MYHSDGCLITKVYRKPTHTDKYLSFDSHHPLQHKNAVAKTLFNRAGKICSTNEDRVEENLLVNSALKENMAIPFTSLRGLLSKQKSQKKT